MSDTRIDVHGKHWGAARKKGEMWDHQDKIRDRQKDKIDDHYKDKADGYKEKLLTYDGRGELGHARDKWQSGVSPLKADLDEMIQTASHFDGDELARMGTGTDEVDNVGGYVAKFDSPEDNKQPLSKDDAQMLIMVTGLKNAGLRDAEINDAMQNFYKLDPDQRDFVVGQMQQRDVVHNVDIKHTAWSPLKKYDHVHYHKDTSTQASESQMRMAHFLAHVKGEKRDMVEQVANWDVRNDPDGIKTYLSTIDGWGSMSQDQQDSLVNYLRKTAGYTEVLPSGAHSNDQS